MNNILQGDNIPNEMKLGYITPIYKKGDRRNYSNYNKSYNENFRKIDQKPMKI
jgi:hypothetical protein